MRRSLIMTFGERTSRLRTLRIINEIEENLGGYLVTVTLINVGVGIGTGVICALVGMPNPAGLGALAATLNYLPYIGPVVMFAVLVIVGLVAFPTVSAAMVAPARPATTNPIKPTVITTGPGVIIATATASKNC